jgi:hypothetical protein
VPKVIDFGVAKATSGKLIDESLSTNFGAVVGSATSRRKDAEPDYDQAVNINKQLAETKGG